MKRAPLLLGVVAWLLLGAGTADEPARESPGGGLSGEQAFLACRPCHSLAPGAAHRVGPNLHGLMGAPAATRTGYRYSGALREAGLTWNEATLTAWILQAERMVPGTWMVYHNHLTHDEVQRLVRYIADRAGAPAGGD